MNLIDKNYLSLQFKVRVLNASGTQFQGLFENIMEHLYPDFEKVNPSGSIGDRGNDGFLRDVGIYFQVYAPEEPSLKYSEAAEKLKTDFEKLKASWNEINLIKEYIFLFNDKYRGSNITISKAISKLEDENESIKFKIWTAINLEREFFKLDKSDILKLSFNIDSRQALSNASEYLGNVKTELDRENVNYAKRILNNIKKIITALNDEYLSIEYEILECRCLQKLEKVDDAKKKYENLTKRFPKDPRAFLYLAEIYLNDKDFNTNQKFLEKAEEIDEDFWLLELEQLVRKNHLDEEIDLKSIDESKFPKDSKIKSNFYRLYALFFEDSVDQINADSFIEKAIHLNPERLSNYIARLAIHEKRLFSTQDISEIEKKSQELLDEIVEVENKFIEYGDVGARNKAILNIKKLNALRLLENFPKFEKISKETFELSLNCYFDKQIEQIITGVLQFVSLPDDDLKKLLNYIKDSKRKISDELSKVLIFQFNIKDGLLTTGKKFFTEINNQKHLNFIGDLENSNYEEVLRFLENDISFAIILANTLKSLPDLRKKIIESLPDNEYNQKKKLLLLLNFDKKDFDEAFNILKQLDLSKLSYLECKPILQIIQQKKAWDFEVIILQKLIEKEKNEKEKFNLQLQLFNAHFSLKQYSEVINIGEQSLEIDSTKNFLDSRNKEALLASTILACFERGKIDNKFYTEAKEIIEKHQLSKPSFEFKAGIEAEVYLYNNKPEKALEIVIEGVKIKKVFSPAEYAKLFLLLSMKIGNQIDLKLNSLNNVEDNTFVKLKNEDQWYFIGNENELDAIQISNSSDKYPLLIGKKTEDKIVFINEYSSEKKEDTIEFIFPIDKYVLWQVIQNFQKLSKDGDLQGVQMVEVPQKGETIDPQNMLKLLENLHKRTEPFFKLYCKNYLPLAMLAVSEGGLTNAIGHIQWEQKGFINFSAGTIEEFKKQKKVARTIIKEKKPFYSDGTSAFFLSEIGLLKKICKYLPNLKVPQSVISLLSDVNEKFSYTAGQVGHMAYAQGKIKFSSIEKEKRDLIKANFIESIQLLESNIKNIGIISSANKADCFSEKGIPAELSDACILAQKENLVVLTEDFLYLKMNELQTKKKAPEYFSSLALLRVLYEDKKISFEEYIDYFGYLSSYRFKFLSLNSNDIEMAVFGDGKIKTVKPENIRKLNFPLTLSEEYGVLFQTAFTVVGEFLLKVLLDNTITANIAEKIIIEILESFPTKKNKKDLGQMLLRACLGTIEKNRSKFILFLETQVFNEKFKRLLQATEIYNSEMKLWTPEEE